MPRKSLPKQKELVSLATYTIRVNDVRKKEPAFLGHLDFNHSLLEEFTLFVNELSREHAHDEKERWIANVTLLNEEPNLVWGLVEAGAYGQERAVVSSQDLTRSYKIPPHEAVQRRYYFMLDAPHDAKRGILILQRHGATGIVTNFMGRFRQFFGARNSGYALSVHAHVPSQVIRYLASGQLKKIEYRTFKVSKVIDDLLRLDGNLEVPVTVKVSVTPRGRGKFLPRPDWVNRVLAQQGSQIMEGVDDVGAEDEERSLTFAYGRNQRTVNIARLDSIAPYVDVSEDVKIGGDGHALPEDLHAAAMRLRDDINSEMGRQ